MADVRAVSRQAHRLFTRYRRVLGALLAGGAVLAIIETVAPNPPASRPVVVAAVDLVGGSSVRPSDVRVVSMPAALVPAGASSSAGQVAGEVLAGPVRSGEPLTDVRFVGPALVARFPAGTVAVPVRLPDAGVVSLLRVGDRVDVYAVRSDRSDADLVVSGVPVVSLPEPDDGGEEGRLVVLAVTSAEAAAVAEASATAPLFVALRR